jgi:hypothetical protein
MQQRQFRINSVSYVSPADNYQIKSLLSYFRVSVALLALKYSRTDQMKCNFSWLQHALCDHNPKSMGDKAWMAGNG